MVFKLHGQVPVSRFIAGKDQNTAGFAVQPVYRKHGAVPALQHVEQAVWCAGPVGYRQDACGFIDHDDVVVFKYDV
jgi:hypothetical protein